jgi:hypothetical protein
MILNPIIRVDIFCYEAVDVKKSNIFVASARAVISSDSHFDRSIFKG